MCPQDFETACKQPKSGFNFFVISEQISGVQLGSQGGLGLDFDPSFPLASYPAYLKNVGVTSKNMVTLSHEKYGTMEIILGGYESENNFVPTWYDYKRVAKRTGNGTTRAMLT